MQTGPTKQTLLVVDADPKSLRVLDVSLKKAGFHVITAATAREALTTLETASPDLVISDTHLPDLDGFELCRRLRQRPEWTKLPFIFLSSRTSVEEKIQGLELGVEDCLSRPIYIKEITARVKMLLQRQQRERLESRRESRTRFSGQLAEMSVVDLVQTFEINRKSGIVHLASPDRRRGDIYFRDGRVVDAEVGRLAGAEALFRLFSWNGGDFEVEFKAIRRKDVIELSPQALLMEAMRRLDEWTRLLEQLPALETVFEVDYHLLADRLAEIPDEVNGILRLFDGRRTFQQVLDDCEFSDLDAAQIIGRLLQEKVICETGRAHPSLEVESPARPAASERLERWLGAAPPDENEEGGQSAIPDAVPLLLDEDSPTTQPYPFSPDGKGRGTEPASSPAAVETPVPARAGAAVEGLRPAPAERRWAPAHAPLSERALKPPPESMRSSPDRERTPPPQGGRLSPERLRTPPPQGVRSASEGQSGTALRRAETRFFEPEAAESSLGVANAKAAPRSNEQTRLTRSPPLPAADEGGSADSVEAPAELPEAMPGQDVPAASTVHGPPAAAWRRRAVSSEAHDTTPDRSAYATEEITFVGLESFGRRRWRALGIVGAAAAALIVAVLLWARTPEESPSAARTAPSGPTAAVERRPDFGRSAAAPSAPASVANPAPGGAAEARTTASAAPAAPPAAGGRAAPSAGAAAHSQASPPSIGEADLVAPRAERAAGEAGAAPPVAEAAPPAGAVSPSPDEARSVATPLSAPPRGGGAPAASAAVEPPPGLAAGAAAAATRSAAAQPNTDGALRPEVVLARAACRAALDRERYREARASCSKALSLQPSAADTMVMLADVALAEGRTAEALKLATGALAVDPRLPEAYVVVGTVEQLGGRRDRAEVAFRRYLELAPRGKYARDVRAILGPASSAP